MWFLWIFSLFEGWNLPNEENSTAPKKVKMAETAIFALLYYPQNWFHVKSQWYKNDETFTLYNKIL